ncbi:MAG: hypothetical protein NC180_12815 [Muribaculaceae bacterium]|nr:hypothetical protein [Muribaculaceae bacterium]MCM1494084.1 hypothetical protein [Muribaculaceae bacterium]MCM1561347.1 hypothetical protein [Butyrivibrio sp.]
MGGQITAVIDADFFIKTTKYEQNTSLFCQIMHDLNMYPVMHRFVVDTELKNDLYLPTLINNRQLSVIDYDDYLLDDNDREEYEEYFREAYEKLNHFSFPTEDIYHYAQTDESLGEIRSLYMARKKSYCYFMSDDGGSKLLARNFFSSKYTINILSLYEALVQCKEKGTCLTWKNINPTVTNAMRLRQDRITALRELYRTNAVPNT